MDNGAHLGIFDSGLGGLAVVRHLVRRGIGPIRFIADQAYCPYGDRPLAEIHDRALTLTEHLASGGATTIVMACNISTAAALPEAQTRFSPGVRCFGMIAPAVQGALHRTRTGRIGVLATRGTVASGAYPRALRRASRQLRVVQQACPGFVPLVESGQTTGPEALRMAKRYLAPLVDADVDTIVLGCTHYPLLQDLLRSAWPAHRTVHFVDPAAWLADHLLAEGMRSDARITPLLETSGSVPSFAAQLEQWWPDRPSDAQARAFAATPRRPPPPPPPPAVKALRPPPPASGGWRTAWHRLTRLPKRGPAVPPGTHPGSP